MPKKKTTAPRPKLRADAERNRRHVLETAQQVFAAEGLGVPIDEIARRAGLGVGTLYRHFPTKEALFEAIVVDRMTRMAARAEELADTPDPGAAFFTMLEAMAVESAKKKDFVHALGDAFATRRTFHEAKQRFRASLDVLLERAQRAGAVRPDVSTSDAIALLRGVLSIPDASADARARHLAIVFDGLRQAPPRRRRS
jgi:AcrR family transcriptional regulator